ncbi:MAG: hypothetical protein KDA63_19885 [Planctomycetales bacterium]|nr:hypothetical protein [Planctomycetales bacterium]
MTGRLPLLRQISWYAVAPQIIALTSAIALATYLLADAGLYVGGFLYLAYSSGSRQLIPRYHRRGIRLVRQQQFDRAIPLFEKSLAFFDRNSWLDRYRSIVLMSASAISYREMAMANIAFCHAQLGHGSNARYWYERCLERYPDSALATTALRMLDAGNDKAHA